MMKSVIPSCDSAGAERADIVVMVSHFPPAYLGGGPARTLEAMVKQSSAPDRIRVVTSDTDHCQSHPLEVARNAWTDHAGTRVRYTSLGRPLELGRAMLAARRLRPRFLYLNSLFHLRLSLVPLLLARLGWWRDVQVVLAPRGEADLGALRLKRRKKRLFLAVIRTVGLHQGVLWHASSRREAQDIAALGAPTQSILVKENETLLPRLAARRGAADSGLPSLLYVGRISRKKQLELLLAALADVDRPFSLRIVGDCDDPEYESELKSLAAPLGDAVKWHGPADRDQVFTYFDNSTYACFPTAGENFGHVIAESLSRGCPVLVMDVTPWTPVILDGGGQVVPGSSAQDWTKCLNAVLNNEDPIDAHNAAADAYDRWRASRDSMCFFDYLLAGTHSDLIVGA